MEERIRKLEQHNNDLRRKQSKLFSEIIYMKMVNALDIPWGVLEGVQVGTSFELPSETGSIFTTPSKTEEGLLFSVDFRGKAILSKHYHSDCLEVIFPKNAPFHVIVEKPGVTKEFEEYEVQVGQHAIFNPNEIHQVTCLENQGYLDVKFIKTP